MRDHKSDEDEIEDDITFARNVLQALYLSCDVCRSILLILSSHEIRAYTYEHAHRLRRSIAEHLVLKSLESFCWIVLL